MSVKKERKLEKLLQSTEKTIVGLKAKIAELTQELKKYRSVRGQLNMGSLQQEKQELRQRNSLYKTIIKQHGLAHLLSRKQRQDVR